MSEYEVTPQRRIPARWYLALVGVIMVLQGGGVLFGWAPVPGILELLYPNKEPPAFESRDLTWAWVFLITGGAMVVWIVVRLVGWRQVIRADGQGVHVPLAGPLGRLTLIPWGQIGKLESRQGSDDFGPFPAVLIGVEDERLFPRRPWGARWLDGGVLSVSAEGWSVDPAVVVGHLQEVRTARTRSSLEDAELEELAGEVATDQQATADAKDGVTTPVPAQHEEGCSE